MMNASAYAPVGYDSFCPERPPSQQDAGTAQQLSERLNQAGSLTWKLVSLPRRYFQPENSFTDNVKGLRADLFPSLSIVEANRMTLVQNLERGWDGGDAEPVKSESIKAACELLLSLKSEHPAAQDARVLPIADGRIQLEWHDADRSLEFEFTDSGWIAIGLDRSGPPGETQYYSLEIEQPKSATVAAAYEWFVRKNPTLAPWPSP